MKIDKREYERLQYVFYNYEKLKELIRNLSHELESLEIIMEHDLNENDMDELLDIIGEDIEEI